MDMNNQVYPPTAAPAGQQFIFLAGPIKGAVLWQEEAIKMIHEIDPTIFVASPRSLQQDTHEDFTEKKHMEQVDWETQHLRRAGKEGVILFWLAKEKDHFCERAYAQTTRFELAEWKMRHERDGAALVVGIEGGFSGGRYIKRRLSQDCPNIPLCSTLQETCEKAVRLFSERNSSF